MSLRVLGIAAGIAAGGTLLIAPATAQTNVDTAVVKVPSFIDAARVADLADAWRANSAQAGRADIAASGASARARGEALSQRFIEASVEQARAPLDDAPAPTPIAATPIEVSTEPTQTSPVAAATTDPPAADAARNEPAANDPAAPTEAKIAAPRVRTQRTNAAEPRRRLRTALIKPRATKLPDDAPGLGPAGRMSTDYGNWDAFPQ